jgi:hypothetical protein
MRETQIISVARHIFHSIRTLHTCFQDLHTAVSAAVGSKRDISAMDQVAVAPPSAIKLLPAGSARLDDSSVMAFASRYVAQPMAKGR